MLPSFMQIISVLEMLLQSYRSYPASVVLQAILRLSLRCRASFPHRPAGLECSISLKMQLLTSNRYSSGSIFQISSTFFFLASWYSKEQSILKYNFRSNFSCLSFFLISSLCYSNCSKIYSNSSSLRDSISGSECILDRQKPNRNPSKQRQMILQMISSGAPAETLPQAADEAVPRDQYMVQSSCMLKPSLMISGQAETLTQSSCGWEQLLLFRARSSAKKAHPTQLTMMIRMNSPQKMLQRRQKGVPMMQDRKRLWNMTILQILKRQINSIILAKELWPSQMSQKMAIPKQTRSQMSSVFRMESHFNFTTYLLKSTLFDISGFMTSFLTRWSRQRYTCSVNTMRMETSSAFWTSWAWLSSKLKVTLMGRMVRITKRQIQTMKQRVLLKMRIQEIEQQRSSVYYRSERFVKSTIRATINYRNGVRKGRGEKEGKGVSMENQWPCCDTLPRMTLLLEPGSRSLSALCEISSQVSSYCPKGTSFVCHAPNLSVVPNVGLTQGSLVKGLPLAFCCSSLGLTCTNLLRMYQPGPGPCVDRDINLYYFRMVPRADFFRELACSQYAPGPGGGLSQRVAISASKDDDLVRQ